MVYSELEAAEIEIEGGLLKPLLMGDNVHRYEVALQPGYYCIYPYKLKDGKTKVLEENELKESFPLGYAYLNRNREFLREIRVRQKTNSKFRRYCQKSGHRIQLLQNQDNSISEVHPAVVQWPPLHFGQVSESTLLETPQVFYPEDEDLKKNSPTRSVPELPEKSI